MCKQFEAFFQGMVSAINPDYEFSYQSMPSRGDPTCRWVVRRKVTDKGAEQKEPINDPLKVLQMRFAKGEISEEEYKRMKAIIE